MRSILEDFSPLGILVLIVVTALSAGYVIDAFMQRRQPYCVCLCCDRQSKEQP